MPDEEKNGSNCWAKELKLYEKCREARTLDEFMQRGDYILVGYAYGLPWVEQALERGEICFPTPEAAKEWWDRRYGS